ncbi:GNAT family N-acetyltransferase [Leucobacter sp. cx-42]|uniref:GNAT family N-acetyltransferase n=1 Tax=unclassified Leucobacter TaxID=2621730 RepID=UPI00165D6FFD|nr:MULTISPECIES: GNAT family N-acetyltransferase [unclassified Leucobacter]MBC9955088.1 GNAT family N-acetyltransferase [Leucobacter sp. cx-42]
MTNCDHQLPPGLTLRTAHGIGELAPEELYGILQLRQQVFVLEQDCVYLDADGRDLEPGTVQIWATAADGTVAATVRVLDDSADEPGLIAIGRVATAPAWRGKGVAAELITHALELTAGSPAILHAQSHLTHWYGRFGFVACGAEYLEDGIPHTPMRREPAPLA